ncbi:MAG: hypothetical protein KJ558_12950 [Gammaproteobacteria bacterium]|nr:hypothetical protein [Gammaproteobacteria bacterium]MBU1655709.1 hypothetical protein [Gammaproteobacteria bacterium]MBU1962071.1 hypothetical protein [Gammaproteobacteria bacterium]
MKEAQCNSKGIGPAFLNLGGKVRYRLEDIENFERQTLRLSTEEKVRQAAWPCDLINRPSRQRSPPPKSPTGWT